MSPYRLVRQISSGPDGVRYAGLDERDRAQVYVDRLFMASGDRQRWAAIERRVAAVGQLQHPAVVKPRSWDATDATLVTNQLDESATTLIGHGPDVAPPFILSLAEALAEAHHLGLTHGGLCPSRIGLAAGQPQLDLFDLQLGEAVALHPGDRNCFRDEPVGPATDVYALGVIWAGLLSDRALDAGETTPIPLSVRARRMANATGSVDALIADMLHSDPHLRPSMYEVLVRARRAFDRSSPPLSSAPPSSDDTQLVSREPVSGERVGRFLLRERLGGGGMGTVFRAEDRVDGGEVALKLLRPQLVADQASVQRMYREARVLAELHNPHIAKFIEINQDRGLHYLAMELVEGESLDALLQRETRLSPERAFAITRDVALALADVHDLGVVHRDIKPANILLVGDEPRAKLCDFGIAAELSGDEELTEAGIAIGTPHFMSPEQCAGAPVDAKSDVYALGITLYKMLTGVVPFNASDARAIVYKHIAEQPRDVRDLAADVSSGEAAVVARMLEKEPDARYPDARALLDAIEARSRDATDIAAHPRAPGEGLAYDFEWLLQSPPTKLWPYISNTERLNRAIGLAAPEYSRTAEDGDVETRAKMRVSGLEVEWREHPYEWVAPNRMGVLREFGHGPFEWYRSTVELLPRGGGTLLKHRIDVQPRGVLGRAAAAVEVGVKARRNLERVYRRIDNHLRLPDSDVDPFEDPQQLSSAAEERLERCRERLAELGVEPLVADVLCEHVRDAPGPVAARIRPRVLASQHELDHRAMLNACLFGAREGLLVLLWDVICPRCQIPTTIVESLRALTEHARCDACDFDFALELGSSVEVFFRAHPAIRDSELATYCIGGPGHTPHVVAQVQLEPGERFELSLLLSPGAYRVALRQERPTWAFVVEEGASLGRWEVRLSHDTVTMAPRRLEAGRQQLVLCNDLGRKVVARVERATGRSDAVTAAEVACSAAFRELFPRELLSPGHLLGLSRITLLVVALADPWQPGRDDAAVFADLTELKRVTEEHGRAHGGAIVRFLGEGLLVAFHDPAGALRAGVSILTACEDIAVRLAAHSGPAYATSIDDRLDYFGSIVRQVEELSRATPVQTLVVSEMMAADPSVKAVLDPSRASVVTTGAMVGLSVTVPN